MALLRRIYAVRNVGQPRNREASKEEQRQAKAARRGVKGLKKGAAGGEDRDTALARLVEELRDDIRSVAAGDGPILVGPFTGEVGFELLYWLPLLRWAVREVPELEGRLLVISRGGVEQWWQSFLEVDYVDILSLYEPAEYVWHKGADKQRLYKDFDDHVLDRARKHLGIDFTAVIHPSLLFTFYYRARKFVHSDVFANQVQLRPGGADGLAALYDPIPRPEPEPELAELLPDEYVAVRFYYRESFPETAENLRFAAGLIERLAR